MKTRCAVLAAFLIMFPVRIALGQEIVCQNPKKQPYIKKPPFCAPEGTRGSGITIEVRGQRTSIPDLRCPCLPIALRYNNPGVLKTPQGGWRGQLRDSNGHPVKDGKGHALFPTVEAGIAAWGEWIKRRIERDRLNTAFQIMSLYAPPDDCVGSIGKPPNCPYGVNPTLEYATRVARAVNKGPKDPLNLNGTTMEGRNALFSVFTEIANFEIGRDFCNGRCEVGRDIFEKAMDPIWGKVQD